MIDNGYHIPVLLHAAVDGLVLNPNGIYVDVTFGGGGHSREILSRLEKEGCLIGFDQDADANNNKLDDDRFTLIGQNFKFLQNNLKLMKLNPVDGILADLGVSSHQFDSAERGFSFRFNSLLDMRMDKSVDLDAITVLNEYSEQQIAAVFWDYGELRESRRIARRIIELRKTEQINNSKQIIGLVRGLVPRQKENQFLARIFQAIRIEVNQEMEVLKSMLNQTVEMLKPGGRLVVITYHSLEDRMVKRFFKSGNVKGVIEKDIYGNSNCPFKEINRKPILPASEEIEENNRARSAKLRIAERKIEKQQ
ncbi:MAG: 16S rRNA (cytosine(1402)-N(4))-methyltransferase RsmH [Flavobacteriales bacterium]|nr:16S rRNA (cytosine(1402)-N(4))-methyltransferase RsmH [Flavobacteriales bacterium]